MMKYLPFLLHDNLASLGDSGWPAAEQDFSWSKGAFRIAKCSQHTPFIAASLARDAYTP